MLVQPAQGPVPIGLQRYQSARSARKRWQKICVVKSPRASPGDHARPCCQSAQAFRLGETAGCLAELGDHLEPSEIKYSRGSRPPIEPHGPGPASESGRTGGQSCAQVADCIERIDQRPNVAKDGADIGDPKPPNDSDSSWCKILQRFLCAEGSC